MASLSVSGNFFSFTIFPLELINKILPQQIPIFEFWLIFLYIFSSQVSIAISSLSIRAIYSHLAISRPLLRVLQIFKFSSFRIATILLSFFA